jgi:ABC-type nitrate/sulfonate/bicarbonate transport system permease component
MTSSGRRHWQAAFSRLLPLALLLAVWQIASATGVLPPAVLPSLFAVARALATLIVSGEIFPHTLASLARAGTGLLLAVSVGIALGIAMARIRAVRLACEPILLLIYPVPKPALIPLFMIWLGIGDFSKIAVIALGCLLPVVTATYNGARSVDPVLLWSARARGTSERRLLWRVVLPAIVPQIAAGVRTAIAISIIVLVSSEFISSQEGLGYLISSYGGVGADDAMLAVVVYLAAIGYLLDRLYMLCLRRFMAWHAFAH